MTKTESTVINTLIKNGKFCKIQYIDNTGNLKVAHGRTGVLKYKPKSIIKDASHISFFDLLSNDFVAVPTGSVIRIHGLNLQVNHK